MLLSPEERRKFADWCDLEAMTNETLAKQLTDIGHEALAKSKRIEAMAAKVVAKVLRSSESQTIGGG